MNLKIRRLIALLIDYLIIVFTFYYILILLTKMFNNDIIISFFTIIIFILIIYSLIYKDLLFKNASLGKKIMRIGIYINNYIPNKDILIKRNNKSLQTFPFYLFQIIINNKSSGDNEYNTEVKRID